jgi:hypothetical protein
MLWKNRTQEEIDKIIENVAETIVERDLVEPAILFFHSYKPISPLGGRIGGMTFAWLIPFMGHIVDDYFVVFREPDNVEKVIQLIEQKNREKKEKEEKKKEMN